MAREEVNIKVSANHAELLQMWKQMEKGPEGFAKAIETMGAKGEKATKGIGDEITSWIGKWVTVGAGISAATKLINDQYEAMKRLREYRIQTTDSVDEAFSKFQVQAGLPAGPKADAVRNQLVSIAAQRHSAAIPAIQAATALGSAGASVKDITGGGLDEFLQLVNASNESGKDVNQAELAKAMVLFLQANGRSPNREGMRDTSLAIQQLFGDTNLQLSNLARFAPEAGKISQMSHMAPVEQLAAFSQFLGTDEESRASTAFRSGIVSLATAGATPEKARALQSLGLKPGDVDFQGEDFATVQKRLTGAFQGVAPERRNMAAKKLFGDEGLGFYNVLLQPGAGEEMQRRIAMAQSTDGAAERLGIAEGTRGAEMRQADSYEAYGQYDATAKNTEVVKKRMQALFRIYGTGDVLQAGLNKEFDDPFGPDSLYDMSAEGRARRAAIGIASNFSSRRGNIWKQAGRKHMTNLEEQEFVAGQMLGTQKIQLIGPDGLDVAHEPAAADLSEQPGQTQ